MKSEAIKKKFLVNFFSRDELFVFSSFSHGSSSPRSFFYAPDSQFHCCDVWAGTKADDRGLLSRWKDELFHFIRCHGELNSTRRSPLMSRLWFRINQRNGASALTRYLCTLDGTPWGIYCVGGKDVRLSGSPKHVPTVNTTLDSSRP